MGTMRDHDHIDTLHQQLLSVGGELERLGHEHIVITVLQDQPSVFSSGKGKMYLERHWQFVTDFVSFCGGHECLKSELMAVDDNVTSEDVARTDKAKCSTQPNCSRDNSDIVCATEGYKHNKKDAKALKTVKDSSDRDTGLKDDTEEQISVTFDETDNEDYPTDTEDSATSPHMGEPVVGEEPTTENTNITTSSCRPAGRITKPGNNTSRKRKNNLKSAKLQRNNVIDDKSKLKNWSKTLRIKRNNATEMKTGVDKNVVEGSEEKFAYEQCPEKLELQEVDSNIDNHDDLACSICKKQFDVASDLTAHNQEHIVNEGCLACQQCDNRLFKVEWQLGEHIERDHNKSSNMQEGHFPCCECGYSFKYQNHLDEHQQVLPDCMNMKPAKEKEKEFLDSSTNLPDPKSDKKKTKTWRELFSRSKYPAKCDICGKSFKIRQQYVRHIWTHTDFRAYTCFICGKTFKFDDVLQKHLKVHDERPFHCAHCHFKFDTESRWKHHVKMTCTKLKDKPDLVCKECGRQFTSISKLNDHEVLHTGETPWACDKCPYAAPTKPKLTRHKRLRHKEVLPFKCDQCGLMFAQNMALIIHVKTHEEKKFECKECGQKLVSENKLEQHIKKIHEEKRIFRCDQCSAVFYRPSRLQDHLRRHTGEKPWTCETCGSSFFKKERLLEHIRKHTKEKPFSCAECGKQFSAYRSLRVHRITHNPNRCFVCDKCGQTFKSPNHLSNHRRSHTDRNRWPCMYCDLQCKSVKAYKTHLVKVHPDKKEDIERRTAIRLHQCEICHKMYSGKTDLQRHHLIHQGLKPFQCAHCEKSFNDKSNLRCHERKHNGEGVYCKYCPKVFIQPKALRLHIQKAHRQLMDKNGAVGQYVKIYYTEESSNVVVD